MCSTATKPKLCSFSICNVLGIDISDDNSTDKTVFHDINADRSGISQVGKHSLFPNCTDDDNEDQVDVENVDPFDASSDTKERNSSTSDITSIRCRVAQNAKSALDHSEDAASSEYPGGMLQSTY